MESPSTAFEWAVWHFVVVVGLVFGVAYVVATPPFGMPDEGAHFFRAYQVSEGYMLATLSEECEVHCLGGELPLSLLLIRGRTAPLGGNPTLQTSLADTHDTLRVPLTPEERIFVAFSNIAIYPPVQYVPHALAIMPLRLLQANPLVMMYAARMANLLTWVTLTAAAVRVMPVKKWAMAVVTLMPMAVFLAAGAHGDAFINASAYLFFALILRWMLLEESRIGWGRAVLLLVLGAAISVAKIAYAPLVGLVLLLPRAHFASASLRWAVQAGIPLVCAATTLGWSLVTNDLFSPRFAGPMPEAQLAFVLANPVTFLRTFAYTLHVNGELYVVQVVGVLGWLDVHLPQWLYVVYLVGAGVLLLTYDEKRPSAAFSPVVRLYAVLVCSGAVLLVFLGVYMIWNPVGAPLIDGPQGRYFLMLLPLLILVVGNRRFRLPFDGRWLAAGLIVFTQVVAVWALIVRYYPL